MENKHQVLLFDRLRENYADFAAEWSSMSASELIGKAEEIYATRLVKEHLMRHVDEEQAKWFLRFQNPLEIVRDKWIEENSMEIMHDEDFSHAVWTVMDCQDTESFYTLMADADPPPGRYEPVTVREFIERHPNVSFDMMTPYGFAYLTPEKANLLLSGQNVKGHPDDIEYAMEITAEELLNQEVIRANFSGDVWHMLSDEIREQAPPALDQGVTMC
ncbi:DUF3848 domain-containing protein [Sinanaerobacter chloroacetimidivorans]|uniref:DUF3848 domain-containing protein n=1 Tax=Sinanaerobacter chloroacetimidivorans TaxID=2818044 RepID=A0A8J7VZQ2_9FIRM|nr:DUF3848 domain-containing protein [Sinanaerobacter chloroacetimidivorans]MBR0597681.1 hypothetical protein [Sinanaerobacter chloroacetimidivorans]